jgi:hypothetical protein
MAVDLTFNDLHSVHNQFSIDGIDASRVDQPYMANGYERGARLLTGSLDTIEQFNVQTSDYGAVAQAKDNQAVFLNEFAFGFDDGIVAAGPVRPRIESGS